MELEKDTVSWKYWIYLWTTREGNTPEFSEKKKNQHKNMCSTSCLPPLHPWPCGSRETSGSWSVGPQLKRVYAGRGLWAALGVGHPGFSGLPCLLKSPLTAICTLKAPTTLTKAHPSWDKVLKCKKWEKYSSVSKQLESKPEIIKSDFFLLKKKKKKSTAPKWLCRFERCAHKLENEKLSHCLSVPTALGTSEVLNLQVCGQRNHCAPEKWLCC